MSYNLIYNIISGIIECYDDINDAVNAIDAWFDEVRFVDEKIDDGSDDDEDAYVMMRSYDIKKGDKMYYLRLFYGNNSRTIGTFDLEEYE